MNEVLLAQNEVSGAITSAMGGFSSEVPLIAAGALVIAAALFAFRRGVAFFKGLAK